MRIHEQSVQDILAENEAATERRFQRLIKQLENIEKLLTAYLEELRDLSRSH